jgi:hypothetical protein
MNIYTDTGVTEQILSEDTGSHRRYRLPLEIQISHGKGFLEQRFLLMI